MIDFGCFLPNPPNIRNTAYSGGWVKNSLGTFKQTAQKSHRIFHESAVNTAYFPFHWTHAPPLAAQGVPLRAWPVCGVFYRLMTDAPTLNRPQGQITRLA